MSVPSYYEINVSRNGKHLFATHQRSLTGAQEAENLRQLFAAKFPKRDGYRIEVSARFEYGQIISSE